MPSIKNKLRQMLNIYHPRHISNTRLYSTIQSIPLSKTMEKRREKFLAHVFQQNDEAQAKACLKFCLQQLDEEAKNKKSFRGRPRHTADNAFIIIITLKQLIHSYFYKRLLFKKHYVYLYI